MIEKLENALVSVFPPVTIDRAMIDGLTALWHVYDGYAELAAFEGKTWRELPAELIVRHVGLPGPSIHARCSRRVSDCAA
jgi:hypothetical protein